MQEQAICPFRAYVYHATSLAPAPTHAACMHVHLQGALLGAFLYGTYEFTNLSIISSWTWTLSIVDVAWGSFACGAACTTQFALQARISP